MHCIYLFIMKFIIYHNVLFNSL